MNYKGHILFGTFFLVVLIALDKYYFHFFFNSINLKFFLIFLPLIIFSFLLPDIDHRISMPRLIVTIGLILMSIYYALQHSYTLIIILLIILLIIWVIPFIPGWGHRGHTHSIIFIALISLLVCLINWKIAMIFFFGGLSHLIADGCIKLW